MSRTSDRGHHGALIAELVIALVIALVAALALPSCGAAQASAGAPFARPASAASTAASAPARSDAEPSRANAADATIASGASRIRVWFDRGEFRVGDARLLAWIERSAEAVRAYYGSFPVGELDIRLRAFPGRGIRAGRVLPIAEPTIAIDVGTSSLEPQFERNWSMTHEMVHLAFPNVPRAHHWLEEGLASYVEPIARARTGWLDEAAVWREWIENLPLGLPRDGDRGLDHTPTWGRTYWGGALYCFVADLEIRKATANQRELRDALRAILAAGGNITRRWPLERVLRHGDEATGTTVLQDVYADMKDKPKSVDLEGVWRDLGVSLRGRQVHYDERAPLASLRQSFVLGRREADGR